MKKQISMFVIIAMLVSMMPVAGIVSAEENVVYTNIQSNEWYINYNTTGNVENAENHRVRQASGVAYEGSGSIHILTDGTNDLALYPKIGDSRVTYADADTTQDYNVSFYMKGTYGNTSTVNFGWKHPDQVEDGKPCAYKFSVLTAETPEDSAKAAEGWQKYSAVLYGANRVSDAKFMITFAKGTAHDVYIDNLTFSKVGESTNLIFQDGKFEDYVVEVPDPEPTVTHSELSDEWMINWNGGAESTTHYAKVAEDMGYEGNALHVVASADSSSKPIQIRPYPNGAYIKDTDTTHDYEFSFYMKGEWGSNIDLRINFGWAYSDHATYGSTPSAYKIEDLRTTAEQIEGTDWVKYSGILYGASRTVSEANPLVQLTVQTTADIYIDNWEVKLVGGDGTNLIPDNGTFDVTETPVPDPDPEPVLPEKELTFSSELDKWVYADCTPDGETLVVETVTGISYSGHNSLHLKGDAGKASTVRPQNTSGANIKALAAKSDEYQLTFYMRGTYTDSGANLTVGMGWCWSDKVVTEGKASAWKCSDAALAPQPPEDADKAAEGWQKYSVTIYGDALFNEDGSATSIANGPLQFSLGSGAAYDVYIDDVSLVKVGDTTNANLLANPGLEGSAVKTGTEVAGAKFFDENGKEITEFTTDLSGKTITAAAYLINHDSAESLDGMIIFTYKKDYTLYIPAFSDVSSVNAGDGALIYTEITLPEFTSTDGMKLQAMVWDGYDTMNPLCDENTLIP